MEKNPGKKRKKTIRTLFTLTIIFIASLLVYATTTNYMMTRRLEKEINSSEALINTLEKQSEDSVNNQNEKDMNNVKRYARGKYLVSKPGGEIYKKNNKNTVDNNED